MDTTIRNLDEKVYRKLRAQAALEKRNLGNVLTEAIELYLKKANSKSKKKGSFFDLPVFDFGEESENLSNEIDETLYK